MAHRVTAPAARRCSRAACIRTIARSSRPCRALPGFERRRAAGPIPAGTEDLIAADRRRDRPASSCRTPTSSAMCATSRRSPRPPRGGRAADRGGHRGRLARPGRAAGRDGRRHRRRRGPVDRQCAELRRALCRPVRHAREVRAPDAGPARAARPSMPRASAASC